MGDDDVINDVKQNSCPAAARKDARMQGPGARRMSAELMVCMRRAAAPAKYSDFGTANTITSKAARRPLRTCGSFETTGHLPLNYGIGQLGLRSGEEMGRNVDCV